MSPFFYLDVFPIKRLPLISHFIFFCLIGEFAESRDLPIIKNTLAFSYEQLELPGKESMGLLGGNYLFSLNDRWYSGLGVYGAVSGRRGGFFTAGINVGWRLPIFKKLYVDVNGFFGGGGGGSAPQGGGLMLRAFAGGGVNLGQSDIGLGYSSIQFPNGDISSQQISLSYRFSYEAFHFSGWNKSIDFIAQGKKLREHTSIGSREISLRLTRYFPYNSVKVSGKSYGKNLDILGIHWRAKINQILWFEFEAGGAMLGDIDGFAQLLSGVSIVHNFTKNLYGNLGGLVGIAGGGDVNTGGGLIYRSYGGLGYHLTSRWSVASHLAWTAAVQGSFKAQSILFDVVYHYKSLVPNRFILQDTSQNFIGKISWRKFRIRTGIQRYSNFYGSGRKKNNTVNLNVNLASLKLDVFVNDNIYLTGQATGAIEGKAGGYATGLVGPGFQFNQYLSAELLGGVAGGGGIAVGSGLIMQPMFNLIRVFDNQWEIEAAVGYIFAVNDSLSALVTNISAGYRFQSPSL